MEVQRTAFIIFGIWSGSIVFFRQDRVDADQRFVDVFADILGADLIAHAVLVELPERLRADAGEHERDVFPAAALREVRNHVQPGRVDRRHMAQPQHDQLRAPLRSMPSAIS